MKKLIKCKLYKINKISQIITVLESQKVWKEMKN